MIGMLWSTLVLSLLLRRTLVLGVFQRRTLVLGTLLLSILKNVHLNKMVFVIFFPALHNWNLSPISGRTGLRFLSDSFLFAQAAVLSVAAKRVGGGDWAPFS